MKKELLVIILLVMLTFPAVRSLLIPGGYTSHDLTHHVVRQISMDKLLSEGQFPPRWSGELNQGFGYPVFLFNYPLPAMLGQLFHWSGFGFVDSVKAVLFASMILSLVGMYLFLKELLGSRMAAFLGAVFYLYAPIRFLNVYVSAAVGSALGQALVPFVFLSLLAVIKGKKWGIWAGGLSLALLILAHNVTAVLFAPVLIVFGLIWVRVFGDVRVVKRLGVMVLLGLGLSAWFWLPAVWEKQYIRFDEIYSGFYKDQFVSLWQLLRSPWGYGLSHPQNPEPGDMSYQLGLVQVLVMVVLGGVWWFYRRVREVRVFGAMVLILFAVSVFLELQVSIPVWENVPFLSIVQFPLRFQAVAVFAAAIAAALLIKHLPYRKILFVVLLLLVIYANRNHWRINEQFNPGDEYYQNLKTTSTSYGEHLPRWGKIAEREAPARVEVVSGFGVVRVVKEESAKVLAEVEAADAAKLRLNQFYFPGWQIKIDGKPVQFNYLIDGKSYGLPVFDIEAGKHTILAEFKNTQIRNLADLISLLSVIVLLGIICKQFLRR
ncbi:hypothetical protein HYS95_03280 [Candidatus Daviesbacteria bacterium]|nr:hypothetical protein [Candidatus Daviesbacteria bacterium]